MSVALQSGARQKKQEELHRWIRAASLDLRRSPNDHQPRIEVALNPAHDLVLLDGVAVISVAIWDAVRDAYCPTGTSEELRQAIEAIVQTAIHDLPDSSPRKEAK